MTKVTPAMAIAEKINTNLEPVYNAALEMYIKDQNDYVEAGELLKKVKQYAKTLKSEKDTILKPIKALIKSYELVLKPTEQKLASLETLLKGKMLSYNEEQSEIAAREAAKLEKKIESGYISNPETIAENMAKIQTVNNAEAGVSERWTTNVRIVDMSKIPLEYFERPRVQEALLVEIRKDALGNKSQGIEPKVIPGVELYQEKSITL